jgi:hypothetical protein
MSGRERHPQREEQEESGSDGDYEDQLDSDSDSNIFTLPNTNLPVHFFLHPSIPPPTKQKTTTTIEKRGGIVTQRERHAHVVLVDEDRLRTTRTPNTNGSLTLRTMQLYYDINEDRRLQDIYVKPLTFITECAHAGSFSLAKEKRLKMGMPGPRPRNAAGGGGRARVEYTAEDDDHLCHFLARRCPHLADGGRMGNAIYKELENMVHISLSINLFNSRLISCSVSTFFLSLSGGFW